MKFILVMALCSQINGNCMNPVTDNKQFINFRECVISGYEQSAIVMKSLPIEEVNSKQLYVKFICRPQIET
mgnify:CR=1 FL=1